MNKLRKELIGILREKGPCSRDQLVTLTKSYRTTIYDALEPMLSRGFVTREKVKTGTRGRPRVMFVIHDHPTLKQYEQDLARLIQIREMDQRFEEQIAERMEEV